MFKKHLFVCTNRRENGKSCADAGGAEIRDALKTKCKGLDEVRVNASGCLGFCERGVVAVIYPEAKWFFDLKNDSKTVENMIVHVTPRQNV